jgi:putative transposase
VPESEENKRLMAVIDRIYTKHPFLGSRRITKLLRQQNEWRNVNRKRVSRLMDVMGIEAIYPKPKLSKPGESHPKYPYLLKGLEIKAANQVWCSDITYIPTERGYVYLTVIMDWYSRYVLSWAVSNSLESSFCVKALKQAIERYGKPEIFNSDQGSQYTSGHFREVLESNGIKISMDGRGRCMDNIFVERLWRSVKYEEVYLKSYETLPEARLALKEYFEFYNNERPHQSLDYRTPREVHFPDDGVGDDPQNKGAIFLNFAA